MAKQSRRIFAILLLVCLSVSASRSDEVPTVPTASGDAASDLSALSDFGTGLKALFGVTQVLKSFRKLSGGVIPVPLFFPVKTSTLNQISEILDFPKMRRSKLTREKLMQAADPQFWAASQPLPVAMLPPPKLFPLPLTARHFSYPFVHPHAFRQLLEQFHPLLVADAFAPPTNAVDMDVAEQQPVLDYHNSGVLPDDFPNGSGLVLRRNADDSQPDVPTPVQVVQNWDTIDDELRRIGFRLARLGSVLHKQTFEQR